MLAGSFALVLGGQRAAAPVELSAGTAILGVAPVTHKRVTDP